jgi:aryl-alcohol dehydrogenase-like predicted oxidoreductase
MKRAPTPSSRAGLLPERFDLSQPAKQRKLDAVEELAQLAEEAGLTLLQLAIAFVCPTASTRASRRAAPSTRSTTRSTTLNPSP